MNETNIKKILVEQKYVSASDMQKAEAMTARGGSSVLSYLTSQGLITKELVGEAVAESLGLPYAHLEQGMPAVGVILRLPEALAQSNRVIVLKETKTQVVIATDRKPTPEAIAQISASLDNKKIIVQYGLTEYINEGLRSYKPALVTRFSAIIKSGSKIAPEIIDQIIEDAVNLKSSDIHFEPQETEVVIRFRIDGVLHVAGTLEKQYYENIVNRIKVQSRLRIDEHQAAQDGAIHLATEKYEVDIRISIIPTLDGEKVVMRLLASYVRQVSFTELGLNEQDHALFMQSAKKPFGMILVTGPTGSGKTTTLYALLKALHTPEVNITTIEDPVEYKLNGINQIQVNAQTNLTFAKGLRSIARQDPDIILVGEVRDLETAEIAVNAALTGHLLFSTFHANDAASSIPRLLDMGIEPFLLASTIELIVAQRLVRRICESCRFSQEVSLAELKKVAPDAAPYFTQQSCNLYMGKGCSACNNTGYKGRVAVFELMPVTSVMRDIIVKDPSSGSLLAKAKANGMRTMWVDGIEKVKAGLTTLEELKRVVQP